MSTRPHPFTSILFPQSAKHLSPSLLTNSFPYRLLMKASVVKTQGHPARSSADHHVLPGQSVLLQLSTIQWTKWLMKLSGPWRSLAAVWGEQVTRKRKYERKWERKWAIFTTASQRHSDPILTSISSHNAFGYHHMRYEIAYVHCITHRPTYYYSSDKHFQDILNLSVILRPNNL